MDLLVAGQWIMGFLALVFICKSWLARPDGRNKCDVKHPPEPAGAWPLVGHLPLLGGKEMAARTLGRMANECGPVFMLRLGVHRTLVVSSQEAAKDCFTACDRDFASRPRSAAGKYLGYDYTVLPLAPYGPFWREMRKIATVEILSPARLEQLRYIRAAEMDARMRELYELCFAEGGRLKVEMYQWFADTTFNVIVMIVAGRKGFRTVASGDAVDGGQMRRFQKALEEWVYLAGMFVPSDAVPWLEWLDLRGHLKAMKRTAKDLDAVLVTWIEEHRQRRRSTDCGDSEGRQDFIDVMLSTMDGVDLSGVELDTAIKATALTMMLGGMDTSTIMMTWALALLLNHRRVLDKVREELDLHIGIDRNVEEADVRNLVYLQAILKETMRLYPPGPLSAPHEAMADCRIGGYHVPAGTYLLTNVWMLHRDPRVWPDPLEFRPERFLAGGHAVEVDFRGQHFGYLPFGSGRRGCPGITFAMQVMPLTLARLLHGFELETPGGTPVDMAEGLGLSLTKAAPFEVHLTPRLHTRLYQNILS